MKITEDGSIVKKIVIAGKDCAPCPLPNVHRVFVKYVGVLIPSNEEFDRSKRDFAFDLGMSSFAVIRSQWCLFFYRTS